MDASEFVNALRRNDVRLRLERDKIRVDGPRELVDERVRDYITSNRRAIVEHLSREATPTHAREEETGRSFPLSYSQLFFWFIDFALKETANNLSRMVLSGPLGPEAVEGALRRIVARNEGLRVSISRVSPLQRIVECDPLDLEYADLRGVPVESRDSTVADRVVGLMAPFDIDRAPLMRSVLFRLNDDEYVLLCAFPHIVLDGAGIYLFESELLAELRGAGPPRPGARRFRLHEFVDWERNISPDEFDRQVGFWKARLAEHELPTVPENYVTERTEEHAHRVIPIPDDVRDRMRSRCVEEQATFQMCLLGLIATVVGEFCLTGKPVLSTTLENRSEERMEGLYAPLLYSMYVPLRVGDGVPFADVLGQVRTHSREALENMDIPFGILVGLIERKKWKGLDRAFGFLIETISYLFFKFNRAAKLYPSYLADYLFSVEPPVDRGRRALSGRAAAARFHFNVNMLQSTYKETPEPLRSAHGVRRVALSDERRFLPDVALDGTWDSDSINFYVTMSETEEMSVRLVSSGLNPEGVDALAGVLNRRLLRFDRHRSPRAEHGET